MRLLPLPYYSNMSLNYASCLSRMLLYFDAQHAYVWEAHRCAYIFELVPMHVDLGNKRLRVCEDSATHNMPNVPLRRLATSIDRTHHGRLQPY